MGESRREVGFWKAVGQMHLRDLLTIESVSSLLLGGGLAYWMFTVGSATSRASLASNYLVVVAALLGIVFAGLALVVSLLSADYLRLLRSGDNGVLGFFRPFTIAIGLQVFSVLTTIFYLALTAVLPAQPVGFLHQIEPWAFGVVSVLFIGSCLELVVLTRSILLHAQLRSRSAEVTDLMAEKQRKQANGR